MPLIENDIPMTAGQERYIRDLLSSTSHNVELKDRDDAGSVLVYLSFPGLYLSISTSGTIARTETLAQRRSRMIPSHSDESAVQ